MTEDKKNDIRRMVLLEIEKMFTKITDKYNTNDNHEVMLFLFDIESKIKKPLMESDS